MVGSESRSPPFIPKPLGGFTCPDLLIDPFVSQFSYGKFLSNVAALLSTLFKVDGGGGYLFHLAGWGIRRASQMVGVKKRCMFVTKFGR